MVGFTLLLATGALKNHCLVINSPAQQFHLGGNILKQSGLVICKLHAG